MKNWPLSPVRRALAALVSIALLSPAGAPVWAQSGASALPALGDGAEMPTQQERALGDRIARDLLRDPAYVDDPVLADYVQSVWQPLLAGARARGDLGPELDTRFAWRVMLVRERSVNAFALPGGYLGVHLGLIASVDSADELAAVLAHELSHVTQRHIARALGQQARQTPWLIGALLLGVLAAPKNADAGNALIVGGQAAALQGQLNFSRDMEREADRIGLGVMTQAGFTPAGAVGMFDKLALAARLNDSGAYPYLRTHPLTTERIADMQLRVQAQSPSATPTNAGGSALHALMKARAQVLSDLHPEALRARVALGESAWSASANPPNSASQAAQPSRTASAPPPASSAPSAAPTGASRAGAAYGAALAAIRLRDPTLARSHLQHLGLALRADDSAAQQQAAWLRAEIDLAAKDLPPLGVRSVFDALLPTPDAAPRRPALILASLAALQSRQGDLQRRALDALAARTRSEPNDALAWEWQASLWASQLQKTSSLRAEAESRAALLDLDGALDRLRAAQDLLRAQAQPAENAAAAHIEASILDARLRQWQSAQREANTRNAR